MAEVELTEDALIVHIQGMDRLFALTSRLEVPLSHVVGAEADPEEAHRWWQGIRTGGTHAPGVITAGTFYQEGERVFWDVHNPDKTVVIRLRDERYSRLVIEVASAAYPHPRRERTRIRRGHRRFSRAGADARGAGAHSPL